MHMLSEEEMKGYLSNIRRYSWTQEQRQLAILDHYFTCCVFSDMPKDVGFAWARNLEKFLKLSREESNFELDS